MDLARVTSARALEDGLGSANVFMAVGSGLALAFALRVWRMEGEDLPRWRLRFKWAALLAFLFLVARAWSGSAWLIVTAVVALPLAYGLARAAGPFWNRGLTRLPRWALPAAVAGLGLVAGGVYVFFSVTRHQNFGSGSWDMGCYNHNIWLSAHFKPLISSVLGDVHFIGDHFIPVVFLLAPLAWTGSTSALLVAQSLLIAACVFPLWALCRHRAIGPLATFMICLATLFALGTQTMINFDFHEIAAVPLALLCAMVGLDRKNRPLLYVALVVVVISKESAILYAGAVGGWMFLFVPGFRKEGMAVSAFCLALFVAVVGFLQPHLLEGGPQGMIHLARFSDFGPSMGEALWNMATHPGKVLLAFFLPAPKLHTLASTLGGFGFLPLLAPEATLLALPNLMERFLSNKREMWGLGFHYSVVLIALCAFASVLALEKIQVLWKARPKAGLGEGGQDLFAFTFIGILFVATLVFATSSPEFSSVRKPYFSSPAQVAINHKAVAFIPRDAKVVAQNHLLPHLAFRQHIWQPHDRFMKKADYILLNPVESAWPHNKRHIVRWVQRLNQDPGATLVFSEGTTAIFSRVGGNAVPPTAALAKAARLKEK
jgi:uncharacterized membrane protein